jgi:hypothetical protein
MVSKTIIYLSVTLWVLPRPGIKEWQQDKIRCCGPHPLERGVYSIIQRQVRLYLQTHDQRVPGNKGATATPTAAVVLALFAQIVLVQLWIDEQEVAQLSGVQPHHLLVCDAWKRNKKVAVHLC